MKTLKEWIEETTQLSVIDSLDIHHEELEIDYATMCEVKLGMFTPKGLEKFAPVLNAEVVEVRAEGHNYYVVVVKGVSARKLEHMEKAQAGYCSVEEYNAWFTEGV